MPLGATYRPHPFTPAKGFESRKETATWGCAIARCRPSRGIQPGRVSERDGGVVACPQGAT
jgi:hypothetical protein